MEYKLTQSSKYLLLLVSLFSVTSCNIAQESVSVEQFPEFEIDKSITILIDELVGAFPDQTELAVSFTKGDSVSYYGAKNIKGKVSLNENKLTLFEIGSISKIFTSDLLTQSVKSGIIDIDQSLGDFFKFDLGNKNHITLKQLSSHSSGLPTMPEYFFNPLVDSINPYKNYKEEVMLSDLQSNIKLDTTAIGNWAYSNYGIALLGYIIGKENSTLYGNLLQAKIFDSLKMNYTSINRNGLKAKMSQGLTSNGDPTSYWDMSAISPAGGIISNTEDLSKYAIYCYSKADKNFQFQSLKVLAQPRKNVDQALGWMIYNRKNGLPYCYFHAGQTGGFASLILLQPETKRSVVILSNISEEGNGILSLGFKLLKGLKEGKYEKK